MNDECADAPMLLGLHRLADDNGTLVPELYTLLMARAEQQLGPNVVSFPRAVARRPFALAQDRCPPVASQPSNVIAFVPRAGENSGRRKIG